MFHPKEAVMMQLVGDCGTTVSKRMSPMRIVGSGGTSTAGRPADE